MKIALQILSILLSAAWLNANAQGVDLMRRSYQDSPQLPIAPNAGSGFSIKKGNGVRLWAASTTDGTIRKVIEKWSLDSGWTFGLDHWAADRDLPIVAKSNFNGDFRGAVRYLLAATELTDLPLQPCFYNNSVLRVVPRAELCDRTASDR